MKTLNFTKTKYGLRINIQTTFAEKDIIKTLDWEITKRAWSSEDKCWQVTATSETLELLKAIKCEIDPKIEGYILNEEQKKSDLLEASKSTDADIQIPAPEGLTYMPFQKAGIHYSKMQENILIGDEMGLGKTIQAIGIINFNNEIKSATIICPASLRLNWKREVEKWIVHDMKVQIVDTKTDFNTLQADIIIVNYDIMSKISDKLRPADLVIMDESHYCKNPKAARTQSSLSYAKSCKRKVLLTGTPIKNRPIELWTQINLLRPDIFKSWYGYAKRYCGAYRDDYGMQTGGATNIDELYEKLRTSCMIRRLKKDVLKELPSKIRQIIEFPANGASSVLKRESEILQERKERLEALQAAVELSKASDDENFYIEAVRALKEGYQAEFTEMAKIRREVAISKIPYVISHVENAIEDGEKVIVFAHHKDVCSAISNHFGDKAVTLTGSTSMGDRQKAVDAFQKDELIKVFVGSLHAAGTGITLTASSRVVFVEFDWTPAIMQQAEDRAHRIGQDDNVFIQYLVLEGSLDSKIAQDIADKLEVIEKALDKGQVKNNSEALKAAKTQIAGFLTDFETKKVDREKIKEESANITPEQIKEVHEKLYQLALMCDGASSWDGSGFNKIDTHIGKSLGYQKSLSPKQAVLGSKILRKYHNQIGILSF